MNHVPLQRVGPLACLPEVLKDLCVSPEAAFAGSGIAPDALQPDARLAYTALIGLLERSAVVARCPHLGLLVGGRSDHRALGQVGEMMASAPTLGDAFRDYVGVQIGYSRGAVVYLQRSGDDCLIGYGLYAASGGRQVHDLVAAMGVNLVRSLTGGQVQARHVLIGAGRPSQLAHHRKILRAPILFDQEHTGVVIAGGDMDHPLPGAHAG
ncbi:AraC family transcriptional regulator [Starkeya koreensis]|uniref:AraC family transcriptional regulator n=1 Tax=Ancylobacter koreensis TaxID=266121 RepID=A0ABT0DRI7_9HYPH|nr:AraC family transcriptional regulator ligand-binding domain-containing protein [Ancylobacter koreensis]MCK0209890.1 AraC family transcriptional regulator [Ancylobacter koreensis]